MKILRFFTARLQEPSTYAGLSALCVTISTAFSQDGTARYLALLGAVATAVGAIAKAENDPKLSDAMEQAVKLVPILIATMKSADELLPDGINRKVAYCVSKKTPGLP